MRKIIPVVAAGATALAVAGTTFAYAALNNDVTLAVDGQTSEVTTMNRTVGDVLAGQGITLGAHDVVAPVARRLVVDGTKIAVQYGRQVTVTVDGQPKTFWTTATTVDQALQSLQLDTAGADLSTSRSAGIGREGLNLTVNTAKTITIEAAGKDKKIETTALTVGQALTEAGIAVDSDDKVSTKESTKLMDGLEFSVTKVDVKTVTKKHEGRLRHRPQEHRQPRQGQDQGRHRGQERRSAPSSTPWSATTARREADQEVLQDHPQGHRQGRAGRHQAGRRSRAPAAAPAATRSGTSSPSASPAATGPSTPATASTAACSSPPRTWRAKGGSGLPHQASRETQIAVAKKLQARAGWGQWPGCTSKLGLR